jgi:hypothetical protein
LRVYRLWEQAVGPHPVPMFEVRFLAFVATHDGFSLTNSFFLTGQRQSAVHLCCYYPSSSP